MWGGAGCVAVCGGDGHVRAGGGAWWRWGKLFGCWGYSRAREEPTPPVGEEGGRFLQGQAGGTGVCALTCKGRATRRCCRVGSTGAWEPGVRGGGGEGTASHEHRPQAVPGGYESGMGAEAGLGGAVVGSERQGPDMGISLCPHNHIFPPPPTVSSFLNWKYDNPNAAHNTLF